jgi:multisubunit Na+/H+ antiporter MnhC subunit
VIRHGIICKTSDENMNKPLPQSLLFISLVLGLSYLVFWGPLAFFT